MTRELWIAAGVALALCATSVAILAYVLLSQRLLEAPVHGLRGLKRARARSGGQGFAQLEPLMRWIAARAAPLMSRARQARLAQAITVAGEIWGLWPAEMCALSVLGALAGAAAGELFAVGFELPPASALMLAGLGWCLPTMQLASTGRARVRTISRRIPHIVDLLVLSLGAGLDFPAALRQVVERSADPESDVIEELGIVLEELKLGSTRRQALTDLARRAPCDEVRDLVAATIQAEEQGTPLGIVLETQATTSRQRRSTRAEEAAAKAATAMVLPLGLLFISIVILIIGPTALDAMNSSQSTKGLFP